MLDGHLSRLNFLFLFSLKITLKGQALVIQASSLYDMNKKLKSKVLPNLILHKLSAFTQYYGHCKFSRDLYTVINTFHIIGSDNYNW